MTRIEAIELYNKLTGITSCELNKFLLFALAKTKEELKKIFDDVLQKEMELNSILVNFEKARLSLLEQLAEKNVDGSPIIEANRYKLSDENRLILEGDIEKLKQVFSEDIKKHEQMVSEYKGFVSEQIDVNITKTKFKYLPEKLAPEDFYVFMKLIDDTEAVEE